MHGRRERSERHRKTGCTSGPPSLPRSLPSRSTHMHPRHHPPTSGNAMLATPSHPAHPGPGSWTTTPGRSHRPSPPNTLTTLASAWALMQVSLAKDGPMHMGPGGHCRAQRGSCAPGSTSEHRSTAPENSPSQGAASGPNCSFKQALCALLTFLLPPQLHVTCLLPCTLRFTELGQVRCTMTKPVVSAGTPRRHVSHIPPLRTWTRPVCSLKLTDSILEL